MTGSMVSTASGSIACTMPIMTPIRPCSTSSGASTIPPPSSSRFITPFWSRVIIQAKVFTR